MLNPISSLVLAIVILVPSPAGDSGVERRAELVFWNVGQGDFITYLSRKSCLFFDIGGDLALTPHQMKELMLRCRKGNNALFISHFDKDHIVQFRRLFKLVRFREAYFSHLNPKTRLGQLLLLNLKKNGAKISEIRSPFQLKFDLGFLKCLWPFKGPLGKAENDRSLVIDLHILNRRFLMTGDFPGKLEKRLELSETEILKVGHHGSRTSTTPGFLKRLRPKTCVVSVGKDNKYGHPTAETLKRLADLHCAIMRTDRLGDLRFEF